MDRMSMQLENWVLKKVVVDGLDSRLDTDFILDLSYEFEVFCQTCLDPLKVPFTVFAK